MCPLLFHKESTEGCLEQAADLSSVENGWFEQQLRRWQQAQHYFAKSDGALRPEEQALRVLVQQDVPRLLKELTRLRPELQESVSPTSPRSYPS